MKPYIYIFIVAIFTISCTKELPLDSSDDTTLLVMNAYINADSLNNILYLSFTGKYETSPVENASLEIRVNGKLTETLSSQRSYSSYSFFDINTRFKPNDVVRFDAFTADSAYHAWAEVTVPHRPEAIEKIDTMSVKYTYQSNTNNYIRYKITFSDLPDEDNYYQIKSLLAITNIPYSYDDYKEYTTQYERSLIYHDDIVLTDGQPSTDQDDEDGLLPTTDNIYGVFDDSRFKSTSYTMTVYNKGIYLSSDNSYYKYDDSGIKIKQTFYLISITKVEYYYMKALNLYDSDSYSEELNEPIKFPSNVHGGTGMIGISAGTSKTITLQ